MTVDHEGNCINTYSVVLVSSLVTRAVCRMPSRFCSNETKMLLLTHETVTRSVDAHYEN